MNRQPSSLSLPLAGEGNILLPSPPRWRGVGGEVDASPHPYPFSRAREKGTFCSPLHRGGEGSGVRWTRRVMGIATLNPSYALSIARPFDFILDVQQVEVEAPIFFFALAFLCVPCDLQVVCVPCDLQVVCGSIFQRIPHRERVQVAEHTLPHLRQYVLRHWWWATRFIPRGCRRTSPLSPICRARA